MSNRLRLSLLALACLLIIGVALGRPALAEGSLEERVLEDTSKTLGWPGDVQKSSISSSNANGEAFALFWPPGENWRLLLKPMYTTVGLRGDDGWGEIEDLQYARVMPLGEQGGKAFIDLLVENGLTHSSYQGREAAILTYGEEICDAGGIVGWMLDWIRAWLTEIFGEAAEDVCGTANSGIIVWSCGSHTFAAVDATGQGYEHEIAAALQMAAQRQGLCDLGDTLVILAETDDVRGAKAVAHYEKLAQDVNAYYGYNAFGQVMIAPTFMDADGDSGSQDWYSVGPSMAAYADKETEFAKDAVKRVFEGGAPREELEFAQVIVVYSGPSRQATHEAANPAPLSTLCAWSEDGKWHTIEVGPDDAKAQVHAGSLIVVAEEDGLGLWTHELGHATYGRHLIFGRYRRIGDRYNYDQPWGKNGDINNWGLMGGGNWWGDPLAAAPVHMSSFSKEAAEWLTYTQAELGKQYTLTALENQSLGDTVLQVDDPRSNDPERYVILEARDAAAPFGAPESGVVFYLVRYDSANKHHTVNSMYPQAGTKFATGLGNRRYERPALHDAGSADGSPVFRWPGAKLQFTLHSESTSPAYSAVVSVDVYTPTNQVGAVAAPAGQPAVPAPAGGATSGVGPPDPGPMPDVDLHAYDDQGRHVGWNAAADDYEVQIPGAVASGDLQDDAEWIYVPEGTPVRFEVKTEKTALFLQERPEYADQIRPQEVEIHYSRFDAQGVETVAEAGTVEVSAGETHAPVAPDDPSLNYQPPDHPGYGNNLTAEVYLYILIGAIGTMGGVGWIVALVRR